MAPRALDLEIKREYARLLYLAFPKVRARYAGYRNPLASCLYSLLMQQVFPSVRAANRRYKAKWRLANPAAMGRAREGWKQRNQPLIRAYKRKSEALRKARKRKARIGGRAAIDKIYARCQELRQWFDVTVDHVIPLAKGGAHSPENLQIIYRKENERKGARLGYVPAVVFR